MPSGNKGILTKFDAIERLAFVKNAYDKINGSGFIDKDTKEPINMCGAITMGNYVYVSNNHFVGKIFIPDGDPAEQARYWDYTEKDPMEVVKEHPPLNANIEGKANKHQDGLFYNYSTNRWEENIPYANLIASNINELKKFFFNWRDNLIKLKKNVFFENVDAIFGRNETVKSKYALFIQTCPDTLVNKFLIMPYSAKNVEDEHYFEIPMHVAPGRTPYDSYTPPAMCSVNLYYFYYILKTFEEYDIVDLAFDNNSTLILKGVNPRVDWKPDIRFAIGRFRPKYKVNDDILEKYGK